MKPTIVHLRGASVFLLGTVLLSTQFALAQAPGSAFGQAVDNSAVPLARNTPQQVMSGAARVAGHYNSAQMLRLALGLKHPNPAAEEQFLKDLQDPSSPQFHHFLTADEWAARFSPSAQDEQALVDWAKSQGFTVTQRYPIRLIVDVAAPVSTVEKAFAFTINNYQVGAVSFFSNDRDPVVPSSLSNVLESVMGANNIQVVSPAITNFKTDIGGNPYVSGQVLASAGKFHNDSVSPQGSAGQKNGVTSSLTNGSYDPGDIYASTGYDLAALQNLNHCCNPTNNPVHTPPATSIAIATFSTYDSSTGLYRGGVAQSDINSFASRYGLWYNYYEWWVDGAPGECCDEESTLDLEWSSATSNSNSSTYVDRALVEVFAGGNNSLSTFADVFMAIENDNTTRILSTSWDCSEACWGGNVGVLTLHGIISSLVSQGWTVVVASGDQGSTADCSTVSVNYPASDVNVIAAGGTLLNTGPGGFVNETGWSGGTYSGACSQNNGGSGGGCSVIFSASSAQANGPLACGLGSRSLPDMSLNAAHGQNFIFNGSLQPAGGTSIVAPELAGFFAQSAAYMLYLTTTIGPNSCLNGEIPCVPLGNVAVYLYWIYEHPTYAYHYPYYDITSGCNSNDVSLGKGLAYYCAHSGYDLVTGLGTANMLQLAWAINASLTGNALTLTYAAPTVTFTGPALGHWYNADQTVSWTIASHTTNSTPPVGIAGYTSQWGAAINDPTSEPTPGSGNAFYSGPATPNSSSGSSDIAPQGQGCHTLYVYAWDNNGYPSGNQSYQVCYDTVPPSTSAAVNGTIVGGEYNGAVQVTLSETDPAPGSGVAATYYEVDSGGYHLYTGAVTVDTDGAHTVYYYSVDAAGNTEAAKSTSFTIRSVSTAALQFVPITPCRVVDTRNANGTFGGPELAGNSTRAFPLRSSTNCTIPATAMAYSLNVTVVPNGSLGYLSIWPLGTNQPTVSTLNSDGRVKANAAIVPAGSDVGGSVNVFVTDPSQLILDIDGYFVQAGSNNSGLQFFSLTPCRVLDTRQASGPLGGPYISAGTSRSFPVNTACNIPANATAYSLNFTAVPHGSLSYITAWPQGTAQPLASVLNAPTGTVVANAAIIPAGSPNGGVSVFASNDTDVIVDIDGYFAAPNTGGLWLYTVAPCRVLDTRSSSGAFNGTLVVNVGSSSCNVSANAQAYVLNATVVPPGSLPYITLWPDGASQPVVSTLNAFDGAITSNMAIVPTTNGKIDAFSAASTQLILDISGYFAP